jgi:mono/diheme cytochrome c family protein
MKQVAAVVAVLAFTLSPAARAQGSIFPSKRERVLARHLDPAAVSADARAFLKKKMKAHAKDLRELSMAVATLNFAEAKRFAQGIANQPRLDPNSPGAGVVPADYFALQENLKKLAGELVTIAEQADAEELVTGYAHLVQTCASCHHAFAAHEATAKPAAK